jgi:hypothetical protein
MSIMDEEPVFVIARYCFSKLLNRPFGCWMRGHIAVENATRANLHHDEYTKDAEASADCDHEVTCQQDSGMIADECLPILRSETRIARWAVGWPVSSYGSRRDLDAKFQPQLVGNALLTSGRIIPNQLSNKLA